MVDYENGMDFTYYTESKEIEITNGKHGTGDLKWHFYWKNIHELVEHLKTSPQLVKDLKELL